ncbi:MAG: glycosyltransferase family 4 protein [bacterium]|nr:glycosyltransferase family 4 protein [bacterium]
MRKLRIAVMVSAHFTTPLPKGIVYAPMDIAVEVSEGLAKRGHAVDFYAPAGSKIKTRRVVSAGLEALKQRGKKILTSSNIGFAETGKIFNLWDQYLLSELYKNAEAGKYDIIHIHPIDRALPLARVFRKTPTVYTIHDPIYPWRAETFRMFASPNQHYVSISNSQRKPAPDLNYLATVYNGVRMNEFPFSKKRGDYLLFVGRLIKEKGVKEAVRAALRAKEKLLIIGPRTESRYWNRNIKPYLGKQIQYLKHVPREKLYKYYQRAKATLVPILWEEPFGLVMAESMACGTPVIAFNRGSVPELIEHGKTGFIVKNVREITLAIKKLDFISRQDCRQRVVDHFSTQRMIERYEEEFLKLANNS